MKSIRTYKINDENKFSVILMNRLKYRGRAVIPSAIFQSVLRAVFRPEKYRRQFTGTLKRILPDNAYYQSQQSFVITQG